jgi:hypothetical protein
MADGARTSEYIIATAKAAFVAGWMQRDLRGAPEQDARTEAEEAFKKWWNDSAGFEEVK